ncbi:CGNR zinc finger domain-containing protein [Streptomyces sp. NPDC057654]|uniref:CGNR zinc finger domain-containing protein n=1 Tax=Streptomyces sp. NPDC057654 TaxID=3346196 RepID=UPI0036AAD229
MHLNPYGADAVKLAVDLANRPPADVEELVERCRAAGLALERPATARDLRSVRATIAAWEGVVDADGEQERAELLNRMLAGAAAHPRLTDHEGDGWHLHYRDDRQPLGAVLSSLIAVGTALHLVGRGMHRLKRCAVTECAAIFADTSRTGRQRYCSQPCANRDAVRRHRARKGGADRGVDRGADRAAGPGGSG